MKRRTFLQGSLAGSALAVAAGAGLLKPGRVLAAAWPEAAFAAKVPADSVKALFGTADATDSKDITMTAPLQAENGAVVPVKIETKLPAQKIAIVSEKNPVPLITAIDLSGGALGYYSVRIKVAETSKVVAYVQSGGKLYKVSQEVKVTVGGCGG